MTCGFLTELYQKFANDGFVLSYGLVLVDYTHIHISALIGTGVIILIPQYQLSNSEKCN